MQVGISLAMAGLLGKWIMGINILKLAYTGLLFWMTFIGWSYQSLSAGLAAPTGAGAFYCRELLSSGGDDSAMIFAFTIFASPLLWRILRWHRVPSRSEVVLVILCACIAGLALVLAGLDCASVFYTAFVLPDLWLASVILGMPAAIYLAMALRRATSTPDKTKGGARRHPRSAVSGD